jgi:hypothetical protein
MLSLSFKRGGRTRHIFFRSNQLVPACSRQIPKIFWFDGAISISKAAPGMPGLPSLSAVPAKIPGRPLSGLLWQKMKRLNSTVHSLVKPRMPAYPELVPPRSCQAGLPLREVVWQDSPITAAQIINRIKQ